MKKFLLLTLLLNITLLAFTQQDTTSDTVDYDKELKTVQISPKFPGGEDVWKIYLKRNGLKPGVKVLDDETAAISFLVDKEGSISEIVLKNEENISRKLADKAKQAQRFMKKFCCSKSLLFCN